MCIALLVPMSALSNQEISIFFNAIPSWVSALVCVINGKVEWNYTDNERFGELSISIIDIPHSVGKAEAIRRGLLKIENIDSVDYIIQTDGRGKQSLGELDRFRDEMMRNHPDFIIANRYARQSINQQYHRQAIGLFFREIMESIYNLKLTDYFCGTRLYSRKLSRCFIEGQSYGYGLELEQLIIASKLNSTISEVPVISNLQHSYSEAEKIEDVLYMLLQMIPMLSANIQLREVLSACLHKIKCRKTFDICLPLKYSTCYQFEHKVLDKHFRGSYTSQIPSDVYSINVINSKFSRSKHE